MRNTASSPLRRCFLLHMPSIDRRFSFAALAALAVVSLAATAQAAPRAAGKASVKVSKCKSAALFAERELVFRGAMSSIGSGGKMQMRVLLYRRYHEQKRFHLVNTAGSGLGLAEWQESGDASATKYVNNFSITPVETRAQYRVKAQYRWRDAGGKIVARAKRSSLTCTQSRTLPDLVIDGYVKFPNPGTYNASHPVIYAITISNKGRSSAWLPVEPLASAGIGTTPLLAEPVPSAPFTLDTVPAKTSVTRNFYGPECSGPAESLSVQIDPGLYIRETNRANNSVVLPC